MLLPGCRIHIVGIGGFGMSAIARVLLEQGYVISGSDLRSNALTHELSAAGVTIYQGHAAAHLGDAQVVVRSSAVPDDNPEVAAAHARGIPVLRRHDLLGELMARQTGIAIAGTHGKTTTTALMVHTLMTAGRDPTYIVGGVMQDTGTNAGVGQGGLFVIEADEYDHMFLGLCPTVAVITNIEHDHPDCFPTLDDVIRAFSQFAALVPDSGLLVTCADDPLVAALAAARREAGTPVVTYGLASAAPGQTAPDWVAANLEPDASGGTRFDVIRAGQVLGRVHLNLDGAHNVLNALAVLAAADYVGVSFEQAAAALADFRGTQRRGEVMGQAGGVTVISDYAHHPTAIRVTLAAYRARPGVRDVWAVWQPHTYGRLRALAGDFAGAFGAADHVLVTDVYSVREKQSPGLDAPGIADRIRAERAATGAVTAGADVRYTGTHEQTARVLIDNVRPGDVVIVLSAGDAPSIGQQVLAGLNTGG